MEEQSLQIRRLSALLEVSQALGSTLDYKVALEKVLELLDHELGMKRGAISLLDAKTRDLSIQFAHGMTETEVRRGRYRLDEGITGKVAASGKPIIVPQISKEPLFLFRTRKRSASQEDSFSCVRV